MEHGKKLIDPSWAFVSMKEALLENAPTLRDLARQGGGPTIEALAEYLALWWEWWGTEVPSERLLIELTAEIVRHFGALKLSEFKFALHEMLRKFQPFGKVAPADVLRYLQEYRRRRQAMIQNAPAPLQKAFFKSLKAPTLQAPRPAIEAPKPKK